MRDAQIPGARSPGRLNSVLWLLMFVGLQFWNFLHVTLPAPRIVTWLIDFLENAFTTEPHNNANLELLHTVCKTHWNGGYTWVCVNWAL